MANLEVARLLKDKRTLLSSPGTAYTDCYYSEVNSTVSLIEMTYNYGRTNFGLNNLNFGGTTQIQIPNQSFLGDVYLYLKISSLPANCQLPRGWGLACIQRMSFLLGGSNIPNLDITGQSHFQWLMNQIETSEKRSEIYRLAGEQVDAAAAPQTNGGLGFEAYVPLVLPFAKYGGVHAKLPLDTSMYSSPIVIQLTFNPSRYFMGGSGADNISSFSIGQILLKQGDLSSRELSIGRLLKSNPSKIYTYPFIHAVNYTTSAGLQGISFNNAQQYTISLQSFINADLVAISVGILPDSYQPSLGNGAVNPFNYLELRDVRLTYNGLNMMVAPGLLWKLYNMSGQYGAQSIDNSFYSDTVTTTPVGSYVMEFDFSRIRSLQYENHYDNVWRIGQQTLTFSFALPNNPPLTASPANYTMYATYYYNGAIENMAGESRIYFD